MKIILSALPLILMAAGVSAVSEEHTAPAMARVTLADGSVRTVAFQGLGCSVAVCSRNFLRSKGSGEQMDSTSLDSIAAIKDTSEAVAHQARSGMNAVIVHKDGTEHRHAVTADFRYLYFTDSSGTVGKI